LTNPPVVVSSVSITPYPPNPDVVINLNFTYTVTTGQNYDNLLVDVKLAWYGSLFGDCGFHNIPIPINNLEGCKIVDNCPLIGDGKPHLNNYKLDLTPFAAIINALAKNTYYQLTITVKDSNKNPIACLEPDFLLA